MLTVATALAALALIPNAHQETRSFVLTNARIEVGNGRVIPNGTIVVRDGLIASVQEGALAGGGNTPVIDLTGKTVYPAFIDGFSRTGLKVPDQGTLPTPPSYAENPPTSFWNGNRRGIRADLDAQKLLDPASLGTGWFEQGIGLANLAGPAVTMGGSTALFQTGGKPESALIKAGIMQTVSLGGGGFGGGGGGGYPGSIMGRIALVRQIFYDAQFEAAKRSATQDPVLAALYQAVEGRMPVGFAASTERDIERAFILADEFKLKLWLIGGREAWQHADRIKQNNVVVVLDPAAGVEPSIEPAGSTPQEARIERRDLWRESAKYAGRLAAAGVPFVWGSGLGRAQFLANVRQQIELGLSRETALAAMTINAARAFGIENRFGTIEAGKVASFTIMNGDFAKKETKVTMAVISGERFELEAK